MQVADLKRAASEHGAECVNESGPKWVVWQVEAPDGKLWACASVSALKIEWLKGDTKHRDEAIADAIERMGYGLDDE